MENVTVNKILQDAVDVGLATSAPKLPDNMGEYAFFGDEIEQWKKSNGEDISLVEKQLVSVMDHFFEDVNLAPDEEKNPELYNLWMWLMAILMGEVPHGQWGLTDFGPENTLQ